jgi:hypothetical protein
MRVQIVVPMLGLGGTLISLGWWVKFLDSRWYSRISQSGLAVFRAWVFSVSAQLLTRLKANIT